MCVVNVRNLICRCVQFYSRNEHLSKGNVMYVHSDKPEFMTRKVGFKGLAFTTTALWESNLIAFCALWPILRNIKH